MRHNVIYWKDIYHLLGFSTMSYFSRPVCLQNKLKAANFIYLKEMFALNSKFTPHTSPINKIYIELEWIMAWLVYLSRYWCIINRTAWKMCSFKKQTSCFIYSTSDSFIMGSFVLMIHIVVLWYIKWKIIFLVNR